MINAFWPDPALALIVPGLVRVIWPSPIFPAPWMVCWLVSTLLPAVPRIKLFGLLVMVTEPAPLRVTLPLIFRLVGLLPELSCREPVLVIVPCRMVVLLSFT